MLGKSQSAAKMGQEAVYMITDTTSNVTSARSRVDTHGDGLTCCPGVRQSWGGGAEAGPWCWPPLSLPGGIPSSWATQTSYTAPAMNSS